MRCPTVLLLVLLPTVSCAQDTVAGTASLTIDPPTPTCEIDVDDSTLDLGSWRGQGAIEITADPVGGEVEADHGVEVSSGSLAEFEITMMHGANYILSWPSSAQLTMGREYVDMTVSLAEQDGECAEGAATALTSKTRPGPGNFDSVTRCYRVGGTADVYATDPAGTYSGDIEILVTCAN